MYNETFYSKVKPGNWRAAVRFEDSEDLFAQTTFDLLIHRPTLSEIKIAVELNKVTATSSTLERSCCCTAMKRFLKSPKVKHYTCVTF